jgi:hypothetical protein
VRHGRDTGTDLNRRCRVDWWGRRHWLRQDRWGWNYRLLFRLFVQFPPFRPMACIRWVGRQLTFMKLRVLAPEPLIGFGNCLKIELIGWHASNLDALSPDAIT